MEYIERDEHAGPGMTAWLVFLPECKPDAFLGVIKLVDNSSAENSTAHPGGNGSFSFPETPTQQEPITRACDGGGDN